MMRLYQDPVLRIVRAAAKRETKKRPYSWIIRNRMSLFDPPFWACLRYIEALATEKPDWLMDRQFIQIGD